MSGKHDKSGDDEQSTNFLLTGPIVIRGLGRGMKDALRPGRPSRHRAFLTDGPEPPADGATQSDAASATPLPSGDRVPQTGDADGPEEDRVDDRRADDAPPADTEVEQLKDDEPQSGDPTAEPTPSDEVEGRVRELDETQALDVDAAAGANPVVDFGGAETVRDEQPESDERSVSAQNPESEGGPLAEERSQPSEPGKQGESTEDDFADAAASADSEDLDSGTGPEVSEEVDSAEYPAQESDGAPFSDDDERPDGTTEASSTARSDEPSAETAAESETWPADVVDDFAVSGESAPESDVEWLDGPQPEPAAPAESESADGFAAERWGTTDGPADDRSTTAGEDEPAHAEDAEEEPDQHVEADVPTGAEPGIVWESESEARPDDESSPESDEPDPIPSEEPEGRSWTAPEADGPSDEATEAGFADVDELQSADERDAGRVDASAPDESAWSSDDAGGTQRDGVDDLQQPESGEEALDLGLEAMDDGAGGDPDPEADAFAASGTDAGAPDGFDQEPPLQGEEEAVEGWDRAEEPPRIDAETGDEFPLEGATAGEEPRDREEPDYSEEPNASEEPNDREPSAPEGEYEAEERAHIGGTAPEGDAASPESESDGAVVAEFVGDRDWTTAEELFGRLPSDAQEQARPEPDASFDQDEADAAHRENESDTDGEPSDDVDGSVRDESDSSPEERSTGDVDPVEAERGIGPWGEADAEVGATPADAQSDARVDDAEGAADSDREAEQDTDATSDEASAAESAGVPTDVEPVEDEQHVAAVAEHSRAGDAAPVTEVIPEQGRPASDAAQIAPAAAVPLAAAAVAATPSPPASRPASAPRAPSRPPRRARPMRDRFGREAIGIVVLVVLALICGGLITAVVLKTQRDAALAASEAANYTPPPLATPTPVATGPSVAVIGDATTTSAASGVSSSQRWTGVLQSALDGSVSTDAASGMGYAAKSSTGETFVDAAGKIPTNADVVVFFGGAADSNISTLSLAKAATDAFSAAQQQAPKAKLIVVGPVIAAGASDADLTSIRNTLQTAAKIAKATWVDPSSAGWLSSSAQGASSASSLSASDEKTIASKMEAAIKKALG